MSVSIELLHHIHFLLLLRLFFSRFLLCEPQLLPYMRIIDSDIIHRGARSIRKNISALPGNWRGQD